MARWASLLVALVLLVPSSNALAKDKDKDRDRNNQAGPAFCRSGAGHPQFGWEWCRERGWDRVNGRGILRADNRIYDDRDDRYRNGRIYRDDRRDGRRVNDIAFQNGYADGYDKGLDDGHDRRSFDPTRQKWYRSGDRHYESRYGSKAQYENVYREGFRSGYQSGYSDGDRYGNRQTTQRWPY